MLELCGCYEKCKVLVKAIGCSSLEESDKETLQWILEEYMDELGEIIKKVVKR